LKNTLIICYSFPPNPGVGGRRWAKFAKYLSEYDNQLFVVSKLNTQSTESEWVNDIKSDSIKPIYLDVFYPDAYVNAPNSIFKKIQYRCWLVFFKVFSRGSLYDRSFFWRNAINEKVKNIITENKIKNLIVTGPPFRLMYYSALLKLQLKDINLILDFRDPWTDNTSFLGFDALSNRRRVFEKKMEDFAISNANHVISANDYLTDIFKKRYPVSQSKFCTIINGFDSAENTALNLVATESEKSTIIFTLAGTLYSDLEYIFVPFLNFLKGLERKNEKLYHKLRFNFYGSIDSKLINVIKEYNLSCITLHGFKPLSYVKQQLVDSDFCLIYTAPNHSSNFNTKFYEYISLKKPIAHFSNYGKISQFLEENSLGFSITPDKLETDFLSMVEVYENKKFEYNLKFDTSEYDVKFLAEKVNNLLI